MRFMGFSIKASKKEDSKTVEELEKVLQSEINSCDRFEAVLTEEIQQIKDIKDNFKIIKDQMHSLRALAERRDSIIQQLLHAQSVQQTDIDILQCKEYFKMLQTIDAQFAPMLQSVTHEIKNLYVHKTHELYKESEYNQKVLQNIDSEARSLVVEIHTMQRKASAFDADLLEIQKRVLKIEQERTASPVNHPGFKF
jgi:viroplasmin and RNaseH domain-containing protein